MLDRLPITVTGTPVEAWFTACMIARFAPVSPDQIHVHIQAHAEGDDPTLILRPELRRLHTSLGLDIRRLGAKPVPSWPAGQGQQIPFGKIGNPYNGVSFVSIWQRGMASLADIRPLTDYAAIEPNGAYAIDAPTYAEALHAIALRVGVTEAREAADTVIQTSPVAADQAVASPVLVGAASVPIRLRPALGLLALEQSVRAMIDCWSWRERDRLVCAREFERRMTALEKPLADMQSLLLDGAPYTDGKSLLDHRCALWRRTGRIAPIDDDPFQAQEWMAAMIYAGHVPEREERLARRLTMDEIQAHLQACAPREVANAE